MMTLFLVLFLSLLGGLMVCRSSETPDEDKKPDLKTENILAALPQTQCGSCDYPGCKPYAEAIISGEADINQCPPGGSATIKILADLLGRQTKPLDTSHGLEKQSQIAIIDETLCIGCVKCIKVCPTDAILGAAKQMHTVLAAECTGCELCIAPCPMDCISMQASY